MTQKMKIFTTALILVMSPAARAGWFGPSQADKDKVTVEVDSVAKCGPGLIAFEIKNGSDYTVEKISFNLIGKYPGRSSELDLTGSYGGHETDVIMKPHTSRKTCFGADLAEWKEGSTLVVHADVVQIVFEN